MFIQIIKMLYYDRIDDSEGIDMLIKQAHQKSAIFFATGIS